MSDAGPDDRLCNELRRRLADLAAATSSRDVFVLDAWGHLWCSARAVDAAARADAVRIAAAASKAAKKPLQRGGQVDRALPRVLGFGYVRSFAGVYVLLLCADAEQDAVALRLAIGRALPQIERLTVGLPPPSGRGPDGGGAA